MEQKEVTVVIVCMNNIQMLFPCLDSIIQNTHKVSYEIIVVAYLFSEGNLALLKEKYSTVTIIESNEIRGFSENNNLALRKVKGRFTLILNDDTYFEIPLVDSLVESFNKQKDADFFSPIIFDKEGLFCGRPPEDLLSFFLYHIFRIKFIRNKNKCYISQQGLFQTYNIAGCCFMVKTDVLKELGYFNEEYFFCPEDIELSTIANQRGKKCYVNSSLVIFHKQGSTYNNTSTATFPAMYKGFQIFYSKIFLLPSILIDLILLMSLAKYWIFWLFQFSEKGKINRKRYSNAIFSLISRKTPKEIFIKYFHNIMTYYVEK